MDTHLVDTHVWTHTLFGSVASCIPRPSATDESTPSNAAGLMSFSALALSPASDGSLP